MTTRTADTDSWKALPWKRFQQIVFRLQTRIYKARKNGNHKLVRKLQKLLLNSKAAKYLAVRQVTQLNQGKSTAGVDGKKALTTGERINLADQLSSGWKTWKHQPLRRVEIPKKDGTKRKLGIPTIGDRAYQCLLKYALEPAAEATFHGNSYGFRPGRGCHDVQKRLFTALRSSSNGKHKTVIEMDIEKCFDRISHKTILEKVELPPVALKGLRLAIKAGVRGEFATSTEGTPQGGVISPLLANIALNGIENQFGKSFNITCLRYADDLVFFHPYSDSATQMILSKTEKFLESRGLQIKQSKTRTVQMATDSFDFLGWNFAVKPNGKFISTPTKESTVKVKVKVKETMKDSRFTLQERITKCGSIVRGWRNYHRYCDMSGHALWSIALWTWKFIRKQKSSTTQSTNAAINIAFPTVPWKACSHNNVTGDKSVFDGDLAYWAKRENSKYSGIHASLLKKQAFKCATCGLSFLPGGSLELHHIDGNHDNWALKNLEMLHRHCHQHKPIHGEARVARNQARKGEKVDID